jgi:hypothetical protein
MYRRNQWRHRLFHRWNQRRQRAMHRRRQRRYRLFNRWNQRRYSRPLCRRFLRVHDRFDRLNRFDGIPGRGHWINLR